MKDDAKVERRSLWTRETKLYLLYAAALAMLWAGPLVQLVRLSLRDGLASHTILIPFISAYLIWMRRDRIPAAGGGVRWPAILPGLAGIAMLALRPTPADQVSAQIFSLCLLLWAGGFAIVGSRIVKSCAFPALFLIFTVPLPSAVVAVVETFFQHTSAALAFAFIDFSGTPVLRQGLVFSLPRITLEVAPECSGIRSSFVLFMLSLVAGNLFLTSNWKRLWLTLFVVPLGIVRNAFRVFVLAMLCVHVDTAYIDSPLHHQGGPLFFALSLGPFFLMLIVLRRYGAKKKEEGR
jgi:exosortase C (VPDSG-CTERM-specific)